MIPAFAPVEDILARRDALLRKSDPTDIVAATATEMPEPVIAPVETPKGTFVTRPNGEKYVLRKFRGTNDVAFLRKARENRQPVLLMGPPGTGKTAMMEAAFPGLYTLTGTSETETADFLGSWVALPDGKYEWVDGPQVLAMEAGEPLFVDEIALVDSRALAVLYSVMDGRKSINITANPSRGTVTAQEGFIVMAACNPHVPGAIMSDALLSRFLLKPEVTTDWDLAKGLGVPLSIINVAKNLEKKRQTGSVTSSPQLRELLAYRDILSTFGKEFADANFLSTARPEDLPVYQEFIATEPLSI